MSRIEFMEQLEGLLRDISADERAEALQYYNDYFDDAGKENEEHIIAELESPQKVAAIIKAELKGASEENSQYSETGYTDTRFEEKDSPANRTAAGEKEPPRRSKGLNLLLIILIIVIGGPIVIPLGVGLVATVFGIVTAFFAVLVSLVIASIAIAVAGIGMICVGIGQLFYTFPVGLAFLGAGLIVFVIGAIATVFSSKLCLVIIPASFRALVNICQRPFRRKEVSV
ncbi:DUF1700 domain-containing protein [Lachnospiraceae bacterium OttesenSCG-928-E19]|nr:DUF1700 domain-containing protein [Lachnospiraceae bacterium OttesenSCG-928-E19]